MLDYSYAKEIAISFDDAPRRLTGHFSAHERARELTKALQSVEVKEVTFYCNSSFVNDSNKDVLKIYDKAGWTIANHTHTHPSFNTNDFKTYKKDFLIAHENLSHFKNFKRLFRFPYLKEGDTLTKRDGMRALLKSQNYRNGYVTVDFSDWYLEDLFRQSLAKKEKVDLNRLRDLYISLAKESLLHYDNLAKKYLGYSPKHTLLLHETDLAALFIDDLVLALRSMGWRIISNERAYKDRLAEFMIDKPLKRNPGRVGELAFSKGHPVDRIWAKSTYPKYILKRYREEVLRKKETLK